jgi:restriction system protein
MPRQKESNAELLLKLPWWISAAMGVLVFAALRWGVPAWAGNDNLRQIVAKGIVPLAPLPLLFFEIFAAGSYWFGCHRRRLVDGQTSLESIRNTPWKQFEFLVAEAYRRQGYQVEFSLGRGADGGVDLTLRRDGRTSLVQCKQWKVFSVGAPVIREMFGLLTAEKADEAIIVTSGNFTRDAQDFAAGKPIHLIDGPQLLALVQSVQTSPPPPILLRTGEKVAESRMRCLQQLVRYVARPMVLRTARRGANAGNQFWGCSAYPACKGTLKFFTPAI